MAHQHHTSFLFNANELYVNEDPESGGRPPRVNENGRWVPPVYRDGFLPQTPGRMFRWNNGHIEYAGSNYQWINGQGLTYPNNETLQHYSSTTLFWCNEFTQFQMMEADATTIDIATSDFPYNRWYPLTFRYEGTLSRVSASVEEQYLAGRDGAWIAQLGLQAYRNRRNRRTEGLAGNLATIVALVAFSCTDDDTLYNVLINNRAWRGQLRVYDAEHGRRPERGVVGNIYLDPENPNGSTYDALRHLEWTDGPIIY
ncbi:hypothetical protein BGAL_0169g00120 [Botrytis galanthina]|uniref:Uncharacterized protein n=1 Tax=Botrytis galanthina TaxID=278940 RepID=A0A4S8QZH1_9HELO|nr:hypothetical protein BGAL_0169g00120 [Botrytis galanthina]